MAWSNIGGGGENVKPEVDIQTPLIEDIKESLVGKATGANATEDTILEGYSAYVGQELVVGKYKPHGLYVWKKYEYESSTVGDFVDYVVSDTETEYPDGDVKDGYYYESLESSQFGMIFNEIGDDYRPIRVTFRSYQTSPYLQSGFAGNYAAGFPAANTFKNVEYIYIDYENEIMPYLFNKCFSQLTKPCKLKLSRNVKKINYAAFPNASTSSGTLKVFIPSTVTYIDGSSNREPPFLDGSNIEFYCEAESKPSNWAPYWNRNDGYSSGTLFTTTWGVTEAEFDAI